MADDLDEPTLLSAVAAFGSAVNAGATLPELLTLVARAACELMPVDFCAVMLPDDAHELLMIVGSHGLSAEYIDIVNRGHPVRLAQGPETSPSLRAYLTGEPVQVHDTSTYPGFHSWAGVAKLEGFVSLITLPLIADGKTLGTLNCYTRAPRRFDADLPRLQLLADQASIAISSAELRAQQASTIRHLHEANDALERQSERQHLSSRIHDRLTRLSLEGGGIEAITRALGELLGRAVAIHSVQGELLHASPGFVPDATAFPVPILLQGDRVASISVTGDADLGELEQRALEHGTTVLALELLRVRAATEASWRRSAEILSSVLTGLDPGVDRSALSERIRQLGHAIDREPHALIVVRSHADGPQFHPGRIADFSMRVAAAVTPRPLIGVHEGYLVALWPTRGAPVDDLHDTVQSVKVGSVGDGDPHPDLLSVVSGPIESIDEYRSAYLTARGAVELARLDGRRADTMTMEALGLTALLLQFPDTSALSGFADSILGSVDAYDRKFGSELGKTLAALLAHNLHTAATAESLFIHKNTVSQRRHRLEELLGHDLGDLRALTDIAVAVRIRQVLEARSPASGR